MTEFDHDRSYPSYDKPFLSMASGRYEAGLIVLHPFIKVEGQNPLQTGESVSKYASSTNAVSKYNLDSVLKKTNKNIYFLIPN